jgi:anthranilate synthase/aminodeoxychorismate synthase-like glutamine amidotransferase
MIDAFAGELPLLGVCLGHQCLVEHFGGEIVSAERLMHGKTSLITHDGQGIYLDLPNPLEVGRYHSLAANRERIPKVLNVTAQTDDGEIMGVRHQAIKAEGVQFHPESVLTPAGPRLLENFLYPERKS